jgi:hypothetical protein
MWSTRSSCPVLMELAFSWQFFESYTSTKFHENPSSESRVDTCGQRDGRIDTRKLIGAYRNFAKAPN